MQEDYTIFRIPTFARPEASDFDGSVVTTSIDTMNSGTTATHDVVAATNMAAAHDTMVASTEVANSDINAKKSVAGFSFYDELNQIAEELEKCRLRNS